MHTMEHIIEHINAKQIREDEAQRILEEEQRELQNVEQVEIINEYITLSQ